MAVQIGNALYIVKLEKGTVRRLAKGGHPSWSPDGTCIAYLGEVAGKVGVFEVNIKTGGSRPYSWMPETAVGLTWSPTGEHVAVYSFCEDEPEPKQCLSIARPDGRDERILVKWRRIYGLTLTWGPEGPYIYLVGRDR